MQYNSIPRDNLVGERLLDWNANDTEGSNDWTATDVSWVDADRGYVEDCGSFNGSSSKVTIPDVVPSWAVSISVWVMDNHTWNSNYWIFQCWTWNTPRFTLQSWSWSSDYIQVFRYAWWSFSTNINIKWDWKYHHIVFTYDWSWNAYLYVDWKQEASTSSFWNINYSWQHRWRDQYHNISWDWILQLWRIYNTELSPTEIQSLYLEWLRRLWDAANYPKLFEDCVWYFECELSWTNLDNIIDWVRATRTAGTNTTDQTGQNKWLTNPNYSRSSITYTNSYVWKDTGSWFVFTKNDSWITSTGVNITWDIWPIFLFNRTLTTDEESDLEDLTKNKYIYPRAKWTTRWLEDNLAAHYPMINSWTTVYDISGNGNDWTSANTPTKWRIWQHEYMTFDGSSDYVSMWDLWNAKSISFWINLDTTTEKIFEETSWNWVSVSSWTLSYPQRDNAYINISDTDTVSTWWTHIVLTSTTDVALTAFTLWKIWTTYWNLDITNVKIYDTALSETEIQQLYYTEFINN